MIQLMIFTGGLVFAALCVRGGFAFYQDFKKHGAENVADAHNKQLDDFKEKDHEQ